jgi:hypothetical protein
MKETILLNFIAAAQLSKVKHIFLVMTTAAIEKDMNDRILQKVQATGIPFTCIQIPSKLMDRSSQGYTYQDGIINQNIIIESVTVMSNIDDQQSSIYREDVAAICVQALQSCDWNPSPHRARYLRVHTTTPNVNNEAQLPPPSPIQKRMDQLWCMNANIIEDQLNRLPP